MSRHRAEQGFTLIEVIIAAVLVMAVVGGITVAATSSDKLDRQNRTGNAMRDYAVSALERVRADRTWADTAPCKTVPLNTACSVTNVLSPGELTDDQVAYRLSVTATPRDRPTDGLGELDSDGSTRDDWDLSVTVAPLAADAKRLGTQGAVVVQGSIIDESEVKGGLIVQFCAAPGQRDERIQFAACDTPIDHDLVGCSSTSEDCWPRNFVVAGARAYNANPTGRVRVEPFRPTDFTLSNGAVTLHKGNAIPVDASGARTSAGSAVAYRFPDLDGGRWRVSTTPGQVAPYVDWRTHSIPSKGYIDVQEGQLARAVVSLHQPDTVAAGAAGAVEINFRRTTWDRTYSGGSTGTFGDPLVRVCNIPDSFTHKGKGVHVRWAGCNRAEWTFSPSGTYEKTVGGVVEDHPCTDPASIMSSSSLILTPPYTTCFAMQYTFDENSEVQHEWRVSWISSNGNSSTVRWGASGSASFQTEPTPNGRVVAPISAGDGSTVTGYDPLRSAIGSVTYVGTPSGAMSRGSRWSVAGVEGASRVTVRPRARGLHTRERVTGVGGPSRANLGGRAITAGDTSQGNCANLWWVRPSDGVIDCQYTYTGAGECYNRGPDGVYRLLACAGNNQPQNCVFTNGRWYCGTTYLITEACGRTRLTTSFKVSGRETGGGHSEDYDGWTGWSCTNPYQWCDDLQCGAARATAPDHPPYSFVFAGNTAVGSYGPGASRNP